MAEKNNEYKYNIKKCDSAKLEEYQEVFRQLGYAGSVMEYTLYRDISEDEQQRLCKIIFALDKDAKTNKITAHMISPILSKDLTPKQNYACALAAMKNLSKNFKSKDIVLDSFITTAPESSFAKEQGFVNKGDSIQVGDKTYTEFSKPHTLIQNMTTEK